MVARFEPVLLLSVLGHALALILAVHYVRPPATARLLIAGARVPLNIQLEPTHRPHPSARGSPSSPPRTIRLKDLALPLESVTAHSSSALATEHKTGNGAAMEQEGLAHPFYRALYERISSALSYPSELITAGVEGKVGVKFSLNQKGEVIDSQFEVENSDNRVLKVHILRIIRKALADPVDVLPPANAGSVIPIRTQFEFQISSRPDRVAPPNSVTYGRELYFWKVANGGRIEQRAESGFDLNSYDSRFHDRHDASAPTKTYLHFGPDGMFSAGADSDLVHQTAKGRPEITATVQVDVLKLGNWLFGKAKEDPLQKYKDDPNY